MVLDVECLKKLEAHLEVLHPYSSEAIGLCFLAFGKSLGFMVSFALCFCGLSFAATLNGHSRDSVVSRFVDYSSANGGTGAGARY